MMLCIVLLFFFVGGAWAAYSYYMQLNWVITVQILVFVYYSNITATLILEYLPPSNKKIK